MPNDFRSHFPRIGNLGVVSLWSEAGLVNAYPALNGGAKKSKSPPARAKIGTRGPMSSPA